MDHRILVVGRDGKVHIVKSGELQASTYDIESKPVGVVQQDKSVVIAGMNKMIHSFYSKGKKNYSIYLPSPVSCIEGMEMSRQKGAKCILAALMNGEVRMYNGKVLISILKTDSVVRGMAFGTLGREEGSLVLNYNTGGLSIKML